MLPRDCRPMKRPGRTFSRRLGHLPGVCSAPLHIKQPPRPLPLDKKHSAGKARTEKEIRKLCTAKQYVGNRSALKARRLCRRRQKGASLYDLVCFHWFLDECYWQHRRYCLSIVPRGWTMRRIILHLHPNVMISACRSRATEIADNACSAGDSSQSQVMPCRSRSSSSHLKKHSEVITSRRVVHKKGGL